MKRIILTAILLAVAFFSGAEIVDRIVAVVGDEVITLSELERAWKNDELGIMRASKKLSEREYLERMIERKLIEQEVKRQGVSVSAQEVAQAIERKRQQMGLSSEEFRNLLRAQGISMEEYRKQVKDNLVLAKLVAKEIRSELEVTDEEIKAYYHQHKEQFRTPERVHLFHIVVRKQDKGKEKIEKIVCEYKKGADFSELARKYSEGEEAKQGGDLGWVVLAQLKPEVREIVKELELGELSPVYEDEVGYHLFLVVGREKSTQIPLDKVKDQIREILYHQHFEKQYQIWLERLKAKTYIDIRL